MARGQWQPALVAAAIPTFQRELLGCSQVLILLSRGCTDTQTHLCHPRMKREKGRATKSLVQPALLSHCHPCPENLPVGAAFPEHPDPGQSRSPQNVPDLPARHNQGVEARKTQEILHVMSTQGKCRLWIFSCHAQPRDEQTG